MKALADYVHSKGLKLGIYSSPGPNTCAGYEGSYGHEEQDAKTWAAWGIDYLKYDWCGARNLYKPDEDAGRLSEDGRCAARFGPRDCVQPLPVRPRRTCGSGGRMWAATCGGLRATSATRGTRCPISVSSRMSLAPYAKPGHLNDPDMLEIGNGGMSDTEYQTHMSLWAMLAAPLLAGNDLRSMAPSILSILTNRDVIAVDQDRDGRQGKRVWKSGDQEIWVRPLSGGANAVAVFNRGQQPASVPVKWADFGLKAPKSAWDLWGHKPVSVTGDVTAAVPAHGVAMWRVN